MFLTVVISIIILSLSIEWYIHTYCLKNLSKRSAKTYRTVSALCIVPYVVWITISRIWDLYSPISTVIGNILISLLLLNFLWKSMWFLGKIATRRTGLSWPRIATTTIALLGTLLFAYGSTLGRTQLRTTHLTLHYPNLPANFDSLRIVQISDLHLHTSLFESRYKLLRKMVDEINAQQPDLVIDCGDMVTSRYAELDSNTMNILGGIEAPLGIYTTTGNHDNGSYILDTITLPADESYRLLLERQAQMGWYNITDKHTPIINDGDTLYLSGINYPASLRKGSHGHTPTEDYTDFFTPIPTEAFNIVISHTPTAWDNILAATDAELTLSGHVHAMQFRLPIGERGWSPAALAYDRWSGLYQSGNSALHITDGIGSSPKIRIGAKPQIVVIELCREE